MICLPIGKTPFTFIIICISLIGKEVKTAPAEHNNTNKPSRARVGECYCGVDQRISIERLEQFPKVTLSSGLFTECNAFGVTMCYHKCRNETSSLVKKLCENYGHVVDMQGFLYYNFCTAPRWQNIGRVKHVAQICCHDNKPIDCNKMKKTKRSYNFQFIENQSIKAKENPTYTSNDLQVKNFVQKSYLDNMQELKITKHLIKKSTLNNKKPHISVSPTSQKTSNKNNDSSLDIKHEKQAATKVSFLQTRSVTKENNFKLQLNNDSQVNETLNQRKAENINVTAQNEKMNINVTNPLDEVGLNETVSTKPTTEGNTSVIKVMENKYYTPNDTQNQTNSEASDSKLFETDSTKRVSREEILSSGLKCTKGETKGSNKKLNNSKTSQNETNKVLRNSNSLEQNREVKIFNKSKSNISEEHTLSKRKCTAHCNSEKEQETVSDSNNSSGIVTPVKLRRSTNNESLKSDEKFEIPVELKETINSTNTTKTGANTKGLPESRYLEHNQKFISSKKVRDALSSTIKREAKNIFKENHELNKTLRLKTNGINHSFKTKRDIKLNNNTINKPVSSSKGDNKTDLTINHNKSLDTGVNKQKILHRVPIEINKQKTDISRKSRQIISLYKSPEAVSELIFSKKAQSDFEKELKSSTKEGEISSSLNMIIPAVPRLFIAVPEIISSRLQYDLYPDFDDEYSSSRKVRGDKLTNNTENFTSTTNNFVISQNNTDLENGSLVKASLQSNMTDGSGKNIKDKSVNKNAATKVKEIRTLSASINFRPCENFDLEGRTKRTSENSTAKQISDKLLSMNNTKPSTVLVELPKSTENDQTNLTKEQNSERKFRDTKSINNASETFVKKNNNVNDSKKLYPDEKGNDTRKIRETPLPENKTFVRKNSNVSESDKLNPDEKENDTKKIRETPLPENKTFVRKNSNVSESDKLNPDEKGNDTRKIRETPLPENKTFVRKNSNVSEIEKFYPDVKGNDTRKIRATPLPENKTFEIIAKAYNYNPSEVTYLKPIIEQSNTRREREYPLPANSANPETNPLE